MDKILDLSLGKRTVKEFEEETSDIVKLAPKKQPKMSRRERIAKQKQREDELS